MPVNSRLAQLWQREELPIRDAVHTADGRAWLVELDEQATGGLRVNEPFDVEAFLTEDPDYVTSFVVSKVLELGDGSGSVCCGEGSWGSEGIFARLATDGTPLWAVYLERSNPFTDIEIDVAGRVARFSSSSGVHISVSLTEPRFTPANWPAAL